MSGWVVEGQARGQAREAAARGRGRDRVASCLGGWGGGISGPGSWKPPPNFLVVRFCAEAPLPGGGNAAARARVPVGERASRSALVRRRKAASPPRVLGLGKGVSPVLGGPERGRRWLEEMAFFGAEADSGPGRARSSLCSASGALARGQGLELDPHELSQERLAND